LPCRPRGLICSAWLVGGCPSYSPLNHALSFIRTVLNYATATQSGKSPAGPARPREVTRRAARCTRRAARPSSRQPRPDDTVCTGGREADRAPPPPPATAAEAHTQYIVGWLRSRSSVGISFMCYMCLILCRLHSYSVSSPERADGTPNSPCAVTRRGELPVFGALAQSHSR